MYCGAYCGLPRVVMNAAGPNDAFVILRTTASLLPAVPKVMLSASRVPYLEASASLSTTVPLGMSTVSPPSGTPPAQRVASYQSPVPPSQVQFRRDVLKVEPRSPDRLASKFIGLTSSTRFRVAITAPPSPLIVSLRSA